MTPRPSTDKRLLEKLTQITEDNLSNEHFGVSELAREMHMSRSNLHRKIKSVTGSSVSQFIREVRLKKAHELLKETTYTISEVAFQVGFGSATYFSKCFHDYYSYPPGEVGEYSLSKPLLKSSLRISRWKFIPRLNKQMAVILILGLVVLITTGTYIVCRLNHKVKLQNALTYTLPSLQNEFDEMATADDVHLWGIYHNANKLNKLLGDNLALSW